MSRQQDTIGWILVGTSLYMAYYKDSLAVLATGLAGVTVLQRERAPAPISEDIRPKTLKERVFTPSKEPKEPKESLGARFRGLFGSKAPATDTSTSTQTSSEKTQDGDSNEKVQAVP